MLRPDTTQQCLKLSAFSEQKEFHVNQSSCPHKLCTGSCFNYITHMYCGANCLFALKNRTLLIHVTSLWTLIEDLNRLLKGCCCNDACLAWGGKKKEMKMSSSSDFLSTLYYRQNRSLFNKYYIIFYDFLFHCQATESVNILKCKTLITVEDATIIHCRNV